MIKDIAVYFTIIMLEAIPFLLLGAFVSAIIEEFVSEKTIEKLIPKNKLCCYTNCIKIKEKESTYKCISIFYVSITNN